MKLKTDVLYGTTQAARQVGCSENTLRAYASRGIISPVKTASNRNLFRETDIVAAKRQFKK